MSRARLLIVDDDPLFRQLLTGFVRKDYLVAVANDGAEAFAKAAEHVPDIAIIDVQMPNWDGIKTLRAFRTHPDLRRVPVIMLTMDAKKSTVLTAIQNGAADYIIKADLMADVLLARLQRLLTRGTAPVPPQRPVAKSEIRPAQLASNLQTVPTLAAAPPAMQRTSTFDDQAIQSILDSWE
jgi:DNA-binding response OmpR family regulator